MESIKTLDIKTCAFVTLWPRIDYCNSLFSASKKVIDKLQHVQNAATRLVAGTGKYKRAISKALTHLIATKQNNFPVVFGSPSSRTVGNMEYSILDIDHI